VGFYLCGAYLRNHARNRGLRAPDETPDRHTITGITGANQEMGNWIKDSLAKGYRNGRGEVIIVT
jgi:hypothetical protein